MITVDLAWPDVEAATPHRNFNTIVAVDGASPGVQLPSSGIASDQAREWLSAGGEAPAVDDYIKVSVPLFDWTKAHENRFAELAEKEALGDLSADGAVDLERLTQLRRGLKNSRPGVEILWEYEQRKLTHDLLKALNRYVTFHKATDNEEDA